MIHLKLNRQDDAYAAVADVVFEQIEKIYGNYMPGLVIVDMAIKYDFETEYDRSNELMFVNSFNSAIWENDWCEGQTDIIIYGITDVEEVECKHEIAGETE